MQEQVKFRNSVGKTVQRIGGSECGEVLIVMWTDGTFSAARAPVYLSDEKDWDDFEISLEPHPAFGASQLWWPAKLVEMGIVTDAEVKESEAKVAAEKVKRDAEQEKAQLERLIIKHGLTREEFEAIAGPKSK